MMTNLDVTALREPRAAHYRRLARAAARTVALILGPLTEAYQARRDAAHLMSLDDHLLKDIGISRCEIEAVVRKDVVSFHR